jgi:Protein of unknown function (DUF3179)
VKKLFYLGLAGLALFEFLKIYFIMPMPGSQRLDTLNVAYFLHSYRWFFRIGFVILIVTGSPRAFGIQRRWKWVPALTAAFAVATVGFFNFAMAAESMFQQPRIVAFEARARNVLDENAVVIGVENNGEAKAYPIRFLAYHHQVQDTVGGKPVLVTYCSVCRSGRVFEPIVHGHPEKFRLVGMDHFNALFEDVTTQSWWRQATGEAVAGPLIGEAMKEVSCVQLTVRKWFELYPNGTVMQPDGAAKAHYGEGKFERGENKTGLTGTDPDSWKDKSWVVGVRVGGLSKAYDWNRLKEQRVINDQVGHTPIVLVLSADQQSFAAFERPAASEFFTIQNDTLSSAGKSYDFSGRELTGPGQHLRKLSAYQEFWHSWRAFHPETKPDL